MVYFRSRRFYTGLAIGLIPFLFLAGRAAGLFGGSSPDGERVVVRNYSGSCDDPAAAERTAALLATLPEDVVLVENYVGCDAAPPAGLATEREEETVDAAALTPLGAAPAAPITRQPPAGGTLVESGAHMHPMALPFEPSGRQPLAPAPDFSPSLVMVSSSAAEPRSGLVRWLPVVAAPLLLFSTQVGADRDYPEGIVCGSDSGLRTGPMRPRC